MYLTCAIIYNKKIKDLSDWSISNMLTQKDIVDFIKYRIRYNLNTIDEIVWKKEDNEFKKEEQVVDSMLEFMF